VVDLRRKYALRAKPVKTLCENLAANPWINHPLGLATGLLLALLLLSWCRVRWGAPPEFKSADERM
jgi:hypothetical protein